MLASYRYVPLRFDNIRKYNVTYCKIDKTTVRGYIVVRIRIILKYWLPNLTL